MSVSSSDASWFTATMRSIGVLVLALGLPWLVSEVMAATWYLFPQPPGAPVWVANKWQPFVFVIAPLLQVVLGFYLLFAGRRLKRFCLTGVGAHCPICGYDLRGMSGATCPECGVGIPWRESTRGAVKSEEAPA
jgi:hypothetical protein